MLRKGLVVVVLASVVTLTCAQGDGIPCRETAPLFYERVDSVIAHLQKDKLSQRKLFRWVSKGQPQACSSDDARFSISSDYFSSALYSFPQTIDSAKGRPLPYCPSDLLKAKGNEASCLKLYFAPPVADYIVVDVAISKKPERGPINRFIRYLFVFTGSKVESIERKRWVYL